MRRLVWEIEYGWVSDIYLCLLSPLPALSTQQTPQLHRPFFLSLSVSLTFLFFMLLRSSRLLSVSLLFSSGRSCPRVDPRSLSTLSSTSLIGNPVQSPPTGPCQFGVQESQCRVINTVRLTRDTSLITFATPDESKPLNLPTCACILAVKGATDDEDKLVRPYTPVSTNEKVGRFDLLIKEYPEGAMSTHLCNLNVGEEVGFKHVPKNVKIQYPFDRSTIVMIAGGTGITPMIQALHAVLGNEEDQTEVVLLYGSRTEEDIILKDLLDDWAKSKPNFKVEHYLSDEPPESAWEGGRGFISREVLERHLPPGDGDDAMVMVCGPPPMYGALCGPREEEEIGGALGEMGFNKDNVYKF